MIKITTEILIQNTSPEQIFDWIVHLTPEKYRQWDPKAHVGRIERPAVLNVGDEFWFEEYIDKYKISFRWKVKALNRPNLFLMKAKFPFPVNLRLSFLPMNKDTQVIHDLRIGFIFLGLEKIIDFFIQIFIMPEKKISAIKLHAIEEFKNLEKILS